MLDRFLVIGWSRKIGSVASTTHVVSDETDKRIRDKISLAALACDNAAKHYDDYAKSFIALDAKAQATAVISGLILASVAAFIKDGRVAALHGSHCSLALFMAVPVVALSAVIMSLLGSHIRDLVTPFDAPRQIHDIENLTSPASEEFSAESVLRFHQARLQHWSEALDNVGQVLNNKAKWVARGQKAMITGLGLLTTLFVVILFNS